jgi:hypothetical protein
MRIDEIKPEAIVRVAREHVAHFRRLLEAKAGQRDRGAVSDVECRYYLAIWEEIIVKGGVGLTRAEVDEVMDAEFEGGNFTEADRR